MKEQIASVLRHALTSLAGLGGFLGSKGLIDSGDVVSLDASGTQLATALVAILTAIIARFLLAFAAKYFPILGKGSANSSGGNVSCLAMICTAVGALAVLPSCNSLSSIPISGKFTFRDQETGAKAVIRVGKKDKPTVRVPLFNGSTGAPLNRLSAPVDTTSGK